MRSDKPYYKLREKMYLIYFPRREVKSSVRDNRGRRKSSS